MVSPGELYDPFKDSRHSYGDISIDLAEGVLTQDVTVYVGPYVRSEGKGTVRVEIEDWPAEFFKRAEMVASEVFLSLGEALLDDELQSGSPTAPRRKAR